MCLACEFDALWFAEMTARAGLSAPSGDISAKADAARGREGPEEASRSRDSDPAAPQPADPAGVQGVAKSGFICEEMPSE